LFAIAQIDELSWDFAGQWGGSWYLFIGVMAEMLEKLLDDDE
jgi:hypothetical protein